MNRRAIALLVAVALALAGCDNMEHQSSRRPMEPAPRLPRGTAAQLPPPGTIAREASPSAAGGTPVARAKAPPGPVTRALVERGRERFDIYCAVCHGRDGYGAGIVVRRGFPSPPSFHEARLRTAPIGHFYDVITHGYGVMYPYADRVAPADRWAIAVYIRALQRSQHATLADVPADRRASLPPP